MARTVVTAGGLGLGRRRRRRREAGEVEEQIVGGVVEVDMRVAGAIGGGDEDGGVARVVDGNIGLDACAAAGFLDDVGGRVGGQKMNPAETDGGGLACVVESLLADEI